MSRACARTISNTLRNRSRPFCKARALRGQPRGIMKRLLLVAIATLSAVSAAQGPEKEAVPPPETVAGPSGDNAQPAAESVDGGGDHAGARGEVPMARDVPYPGTITLKDRKSV